RLFREHGLSGTSISDIAAAADAFPSQITYYFRTKEALFVEAACRDMLYVARAAEQAALQAHTPRDYTRALVESVTATDSVAFFAEALTLTRRRQDLAPLVERTIERLHGEGLRAYSNLSEDELIAVRARSTWKAVALIVHAWILIIGSIALVAWWLNPLTFLLAAGIIGSRQLGLAILMHDGAHGCLSPDEKTNLTLSQWFCAYPVFAETRAYRRYHLQHHARTQQEDDPDLILSAPFPITQLSYRRKFWRDISGQTGYQQRKAQLLNALGPSDWPLSQRAAHFWEKLGPQCVVNAMMFAGCVAA